VTVGTFIQYLAVIVGLVLTVGGGAAMVWAVGKVRGVETSITILNDANDGLRKVINDLERKEARDREHFQLQLHAQEKDCATKIAKLEGQVDTLTGGLADRIIAAVNAGDAAKNSAIDTRLKRVEQHIGGDGGR
jgi:hypothetical protein